MGINPAILLAHQYELEDIPTEKAIIQLAAQSQPQSSTASNNPVPVNFTRTNNKRKQKFKKWDQQKAANNIIQCTNCGKLGHYAKACRKNRCSACNEIGHKRSDCTPKKAKIEINHDESYTGVLPVINFHLTNIGIVQCIIDTGASISIISPKLIKKTNIQLLDSDRQILGISQHIIPVLGKLRTKINNIEHEFEVLEMKWDCILGLDFLKTNGFVIDFEQDRLLSKQHGLEIPIDFFRARGDLCITTSEDSLVQKTNPLPFNTQHSINITQLAELDHNYVRTNLKTIHSKHYIRNHSTIELKPREVRSIPIKFARSLEGTSPDTAVAIKQYIRATPGIQIPSTIVNIDKDSRIIVQNITDSTIFIPRNTRLAKTSQCAEVLHIHFPTNEGEFLPFINENLTNEQKQQLLELCNQFSDIFSNTRIGTTNVMHEIHVNGPIQSEPLRKKSPLEHKIVSEQVKDLLIKKVIRRSDSPWSAPVVLVRKQDGTYRFCVDYRRLNAVTVKDKYPLPRTDDILEAVAGKKFKSTLDMTSGYWQLRIKEEDKKKTAFQTRDGLYEWNTMPFGLTNAPATFQRAMNDVFHDILWQYVIAYLDDIIVYSDTFEDHLLHLTNVFQRIRKANLTLKPKKCYIAFTTIKFLGHLLTPEGIQTDDSKIEKIKNTPCPKTRKDVQSFMGLAGYYRRFIKDFAQIAKPLHNLMGKNDFEWKQEHQDAFEHLKTCLTTSPILTTPIEGKPYYVITDASTYAIGSILTQDPNGHRVIRYDSTTLTDAQKRWSTSEQEAYAVVWALERYRPYILGTKFTVITDHKALLSLKTKNSTNRRIVRWQLLLTEYDFTIIHRKGKDNVTADYLSRFPIQSEPHPVMTVMDQNTEKLPLDMKEIKTEQAKHLDDILDVQDKSLLKVINGIHHICLNNQNLVLVPPSLRTKILEVYHESLLAGHPGIWRMEQNIKLRFFWKGMNQDIRHYVNNCRQCQLHKPPRKRYGLLKPIVPGHPFHRIGLDFIGPLPCTKNGNRYIVSTQDYLTKWPECFPVPDIQGETVARGLINHVISRHGCPQIVHSDCGSNLTSYYMEHVFRILNVTQTFSTPYHQQANGLIERLNATLYHVIGMHTNDNGDDWDEYLDLALFAYRNTVHKSTKYSPAQLLYGRHLRMPYDTTSQTAIIFDSDKPAVHRIRFLINKLQEMAKKNILDAQRIQKTFYDSKRLEVNFPIGSYVFLHEPHLKKSKFSPSWTGPWEILNRPDDLNYELDMPRRKIHRIVHVSRIRPAPKDLVDKFLQGQLVSQPEIDRSQNSLQEGKKSDETSQSDKRLQKRLKQIVQQAHNASKTVNEIPSTLNSINVEPEIYPTEVENPSENLSSSTTTETSQQPARRSARLANQHGIKRKRDSFIELTDADIDEEENRYTVDTILDHRFVNGKLHFLVKWKYYNDETWEPHEHLDSCPETIKQYWERIEKQPPVPILNTWTFHLDIHKTSTNLNIRGWKHVNIKDSMIITREPDNSSLNQLLLYHNFVRD